MGSFFEHRDAHINYGISESPEWGFIKKLITHKINLLINYYQRNLFYIKNDHPLVKLLVSRKLGFYSDLFPFIESNEFRFLEYARQHQFTSEVSYGIPFKNIFLGGDITEFIVACNNDFDIDWSYNHWREIEAVKFKEHPMTSLTPPFCDGEKKTNEYGYSIVEVNIPLLLFQYRRYVEYFLEKGDQLINLGEAGFISRYVIPKMMKSYIDIALTNRFMESWYDQPLPDPIFRHPNGIYIETNKIDKIFKDLIHYVDTSKLTVPKLINTIPTIYSENTQRRVMMNPNITPTRYSWWIMNLEHLKLLTWIFDINVGEKTNQGFINEEKRIIKYLYDSRIYQEMFKKQNHFIFQDVQTNFDRILSS